MYLLFTIRYGFIKHDLDNKQGAKSTAAFFSNKFKQRQYEQQNN
jgi:hypothetical protein